MVMITIARSSVIDPMTERAIPLFSISADVKNEADIEVVTSFIGALFARDFNPMGMIVTDGEEDGKDTGNKQRV